MGWQIAHILYGSLYTGSLGTDDTFEELGGPEGKDWFAMVVVMVIVGNVDAAVEGTKHPMSNFLHISVISFYSCQTVFFLTGSEGIKSFSFHTAFLLFLFIFGNFLPKGRIGLHLPAAGAI